MRALYSTTAAGVEIPLLEAREQLRRLWATEMALNNRSVPPTTNRWISGQTPLDLKCHEIVCAALKRSQLDLAIFSEEGFVGSKDVCAYSALVDPLDGTHNACAGYPAFTTSIAIYGPNGYEFAWVYDISRDALFTAALGFGAHLQTPLSIEKLHTRSADDLTQMAIGFLRPKYPTGRKFISKLLWSAKKVRLSSCSSLDICLVATGTLDAFIDVSLPGYERSCDIAASALILNEAGGVTVDLRGEPRILLPPSEAALRDYGTTIACSSATTASELVDYLTKMATEENETY
jgi:myo-inositol-1(or 4)-monophosphatase